MKTKIIFSALMSFVFIGSYAQDRTTVNATSSEISDNLDLRAVASIFGDSRDLEDFENRLNDPKNQISNLDLNNDNKVDYLRVIETVEGRTHLIVVQSVLGRDTFQDVATVEVEKDSNNRIQVQVVGDVYMYGSNYIYEPVYVSTPIIYNYFWTPYYRPYCSSWYWDYYPSYYYAWNPFPIFRYRSHIGLFINFSHNYNYVNYRRCDVAYNNYYSRRGNGYERQHPNYSFERRNSGYANRYELDRTRNIRTVGSTRNDVAYNDSPRNSNGSNPRSSSSPRNNDYNNSPRSTSNSNPRSVATPRNNDYNNSPRSTSNSNPRSVATPRNNDYNNSPRSTSNSNPRSVATPRNNDYNDSPRSTSGSNPRSVATPRNNDYNDSPRSTSGSNPRSVATPRNNDSNNSPRNSGGSTRSSQSGQSRQSDSQRGGNSEGRNGNSGRR